MLKNTFANLAKKFSDNSKLIQDLWLEIEVHYTHRKRFYHTVSHLENLWIQIEEVKSEITDWNTILFTLFYRDVIYNVLKNDTEARSADFARLSLEKLNVPENLIQKCVLQILATKTHLLNTDSDTNFFLDANLSILGSDWKQYLNYTQHIRKEYAIYPDLIYNPGRRKVLQHFLTMKRIFKTDFFFHKFEK